MAASSSITAAQAVLNRSLTGPSTAHSDRLTLPLGRPRTLNLGLRGPQRRGRRASLPVRAAAVETVEAAATEAVVEKSVNTIRFLAIDAVEKANSGHPGLPMGCAPMGHILYDEIMRYNPKNPYWFNRDRFVLSAGHGCMLQYALLHLAGYDSVMVRF